jgi:hypothetical protein
VRALFIVGDRWLDVMAAIAVRLFALASEEYRSIVLLRFTDPRTAGVSGNALFPNTILRRPVGGGLFRAHLSENSFLNQFFLCPRF